MPKSILSSGAGPFARRAHSGPESIEMLDVPWIAGEGRGLSWSALRARAKAWRSKDYDLAINFEPDIRSNLLLAWSGIPRRVGFLSGGAALR